MYNKVEEIKAEAEGFRAQSRAGIDLNLDEVVRIDLSLDMAIRNDSITVTEEDVRIDTDTTRRSRREGGGRRATGAGGRNPVPQLPRRKLKRLDRKSVV
mgnify:CR=1 FL=1